MRAVGRPRPGPELSVAPDLRVCLPTAPVSSFPAGEEGDPGLERAGAKRQALRGHGGFHRSMPEPNPPWETDIPPQTPPTGPKPPASHPRARVVKAKGKAIAA